ncbi:hypothetical protein [Saccharicrinis aurantiacus]|uniref:hypothetical protein n=1 Tax=Saccharicrinis aurantiacus TaxID=1849719 RepID=UPI00111506DF|nr:hypothetical protein [Saccharicrinis aurantiacus]
MLLFLLFTTLMKLIGSEETFTIPKLEKEIKAHVSDDVRKDSLLILLKDAEKETKSFYKIEDKNYSEIKKLMSEDINQSEEIKQIFKDNMQKRIEIQNYHITKRLEMEKLIKPEEWVYILENAVSPSDKIKEKTTKQDLKTKEAVKKVMDNTEESIRKEIEDEEKQKILIDAFRSFKQSLGVLVKDGLRINYETNEILKKQYSSKEELRTVYDNQNRIRQNLASEFYQFYNIIHNQTDLKERKAIRKELAKLF